MPIYKEQKNKLILNLSNSNNEVKIKVDCFNGTGVELSFVSGEDVLSIECGVSEIIGTAIDLKNKSIKFNGEAEIFEDAGSA